MDLDYADEDIWWHSVNRNYTSDEEDWDYTLNLTHQRFHLNLTNFTPIEYAIPLLGYAFPALFIIIVVTNTLVMVVLSKRHMRCPMNAVFIVIALCNILTALFPAPWFLYVHIWESLQTPFSHRMLLLLLDVGRPSKLVPHGFNLADSGTRRATLYLRLPSHHSAHLVHYAPCAQSR